MSEKRDKCWRYSRNPDDKNDRKWYVLAFVNGKGSCSLTRFEAADGKHLEMLRKKGNFQDKFHGNYNRIGGHSSTLRFWIPAFAGMTLTN